MGEHIYIAAILRAIRSKYKRNTPVWRFLSYFIWVFGGESRFVCEFCGEIFDNEADWYVHRHMHLEEWYKR